MAIVCSFHFRLIQWSFLQPPAGKPVAVLVEEYPAEVDTAGARALLDVIELGLGHSGILRYGPLFFSQP